MSWELSLVLKATVLLGAGLTLVRIVPRMRASRRHLIVTAAFAAVLALPLAGTAIPTVAIPLPSVAFSNVLDAGPAIGVGSQRSSTDADVERAAAPNAAAQADSPPLGNGAAPLATGGRAIWLLGATTLLLTFAGSLRTLRRLRRSASPWPEGQTVATAAASELGLSRTVPVLIHGDAAVPATMGVWRPVIVLPPDAPQWHPCDLRTVLIHELEHVRRGDWWIHLVARGVCIGYWFHPLAWLAWRQLTVLAERACDDAVIARADRVDYAEQLVSLATRLAGRPRLMLSMAGRSALSVRVRAILNPAQQRGRAGAGALGVIAGIAILVLGVVASLDAVAPRTAADDDHTTDQAVAPKTQPLPSAASPRPVERQTSGSPSRERTVSRSTSTRGRTGAPPRPAQRASPVSPSATAADPATAPYVIGPDDVLRFSVWGNPDLSDEVLVRPDGKISLPLIGDVQAAGLTPEQLRQTVTTGLERLVTNPAVTIQVTATNSRQVYAVGQVARPGVYQLTGSMTVLQLLAAAGGLTDFARKNAVVITRHVDGKSINIRFDYAAFVRGEQLEQNILLMPGDVVVVP